MRKILLVISTCLIIFLIGIDAKGAQLLFKPELIVSGEYSDNIFLTSEDETEDVIGTAGIGINGQMLGRTYGIEFNYVPIFNAFEENTDLNYWRHSARLNIYKLFSRNTRFSFTNDYLDTESPRDETTDFYPEDPAQGPGIGEDPYRRGRSRYRVFASEMSLNSQIGERDLIEVLFGYSFLEDVDIVESEPVNDYTELKPIIRFDYWFTQMWGMESEIYYSNREYEDRNDREEYTGFLRVKHSFNRAFTIFAEYRHTTLKYQRDYDLTSGSNYTVHEPGIGLILNFRDNTRLLVSAGYLFQHIEGAQSDDDYGWILNAELAKRWNFKQSYIETTAGSGYQIQDRGVEDLGLNIYFEGKITIGYSITNHIDFDIYGGYRYDDFPNEDPERNDNTYDLGAALRWQALQWINLEFNYNYQNFDSEDDTNSYEENSVVLRFTIAPAVPYRLN